MLNGETTVVARVVDYSNNSVYRGGDADGTYNENENSYYAPRSQEPNAARKNQGDEIERAHPQAQAAARRAEMATGLMGAADAQAASSPVFRQVLQNGNRLMGDGMSVFSGGITVMASLVALLKMQSFALFDMLSSKTSQSRDSQEMANRVESIRSQLDPNKPGDTAALSDDVIAYMRANGIMVNGKPIDEFLKSTAGGQDAAKNAAIQGLFSGSGAKEPDYTKVGLNAGDLAAVKAALESDSGRANDFAQQTQLKMQQMMQQYGLTTQMQTQLLSMINDSIGKIIGNTR